MAESKTSVRRLAAYEKQSQAIALRRSGATFDQIAKALGYAGPSGAAEAVTAAIRSLVKEPAEELRTLELERLDAMLRGLWSRATSGDVQAVNAVLRIMVRRARMMGLDAPVKIDLRHIVSQMAEQYGLTPSETEELHKDVANFLAVAREQTSGAE